MTKIKRTTITLWTMIAGILLLPFIALSGIQNDAYSLTSVSSSGSGFALKAAQVSVKMAAVHVDMAEEYSQEAHQHKKELRKLSKNKGIDIKSFYKHSHKTNHYQMRADWHEKQAKKWTA